MPATSGPKQGGFLRWCAALLALSVFLSAGVLWRRHQFEKSDRTVILAVDGNELKRAAAKDGIPYEEALRRIGLAGVSAVGVHEYTLQDAIAERLAFWGSEGILGLFAEASTLLPSGTPTAILGIRRAPQDLPWLLDAIRTHLPAEFEPIGTNGAYLLWRVPANVAPASVALGFDPRELDAVERAGLVVSPRLRPTGGRTLDQALEVIDGLDGRALGPIVFWGIEVTGYPDDIERIALALKEGRAADVEVGLVEFAAQHGLYAMAEALAFRGIRTHSITQEEMAAGIGRETVVRRWERAVRERGIRLAYVRFYPEASIEASVAYVLEIATALRAAGYAVGEERAADLSAREATPVRALAGALLLIGAVTGCLAARLAGPGRNRLVATAMGSGALAVSACFWIAWTNGYDIPARQGAALLAALVFPTLGVLLGAERAGWSGGGGSPRLAVALGAFVGTLFITLSGGLMVALLLDDVRFYLKLEEFRGVKAAYVLPLVLVGWGVAAPWAKDLVARARGAHAWLSLLNITLRLWHIVVGAAFLGLIAVFLVRSGNQGLPVFGIEAALRTFLEENLFARPRTKEFLIGHPALLVAFALSGASKREGSPFRALPLAVLVMVGAIGSVSVVNTFAHAHTPIALSLARTGYGALLGGIIGTALASVILAVVRSRPVRGEVVRRGAGGHS